MRDGYVVLDVNKEDYERIFKIKDKCPKGYEKCIKCGDCPIGDK